MFFQDSASRKIVTAALSVIISLGAAYEAGLRVGVHTPGVESNIASVVLYKVN